MMNFRKFIIQHSSFIIEDMPTLPHGTRIIGLGAALPERVLTNEDLARMVETSDEWIRTRTGISERHIAEKDVLTSDLATRAAERALEDAGLTGADINLVVVATATPDMPFPSTASLVQDRIGARNAGAFDLSAACSGFVYALIAASGLLGNGALGRALVIGAETLSRITDWEDRSTCILFADGAGAAVLEASEPGTGMLAWELGSNGAGGPLLCVPPPERKIIQNGREVFKFAVTTLEESVRRVAGMAGLPPSDLDWIVPHQANTRIFEAAAKRLEIPLERVYSNLDRTGNTSAASIPIALAEMKAKDLPRPGQNVALCGFGGGLTWASAVFRWQ
jgi:3-oxoacyl-[acyl-carrier-protein] synthase-3